MSAVRFGDLVPERLPFDLTPKVKIRALAFREKVGFNIFPVITLTMSAVQCVGLTQV